MIERQELYCHSCGCYVQFNLDIELDGNRTIVCPNCNHEHYRVVKDGKVTDERWKSSNNISYPVSNVTTTTISVTVSSGSNGDFLIQSWISSSASTRTA